MAILEIAYSLPTNFDFYKTIQILQRGNSDPINIIADGVWTRCFYYKNVIHLIRTKLIGTELKIALLQGSIEQQAMSQIVTSALGLDDPLLNTKSLNVPNLEKISLVLDMSIPGYPDLFEAIVQIIMGQQVSVNVANKIRAIFTKTFGKALYFNNVAYYYFPSPSDLLKCSVEQLHELGLSRNKAKSILSVAETFITNHLILNFNATTKSEGIRKALLQIYGVGNWTIDWVLMRYFRRFDIIPSTDLAIKKAFSWYLNKDELIHENEIKNFEKQFYPFGGAIAYRILTAYSLKLQRQGDV